MSQNGNGMPPKMVVVPPGINEHSIPGLRKVQ